MKAVRFAVVFLALALFLTAALPSAVRPSFVQGLPVESQTQAFAFSDSAFDLPLLAPLGMVSIPVLTVSVESAAAGKDYGCTLVSQKPKDWTKMQGRHIFDATWKVKNSGTKTWSNHGVDFKYVSGTRMHTYGDAYDLAQNVGSGKTITLIVDMISPKAKGYYTAVWGLYTGEKAFCKLWVTVNVNR